jgi:ABC-type glycerol-3-phosphate transport system permease component
MTQTCREPSTIMLHGITILIQVTMMFTFLTLFFFLYVINVEHTEFNNQLGFIVDSIMKDVDLKKYGPNVSIEDLNAIVYSVIELIKIKLKTTTADSTTSVETNNRSVKTKAYKTLIIVLSIVISILVILMIAGYCLSIPRRLKDALIVTFFVALTELTFLKVIASRYIASDPNDIKKSIGDSIVNWVNVNKPTKVLNK